MSNAVTAEAPSAAAVIATTPLPVHRSAIRRPMASPVFSRTSVSTRESSWGAYTPCAATMTSRSSVYAVDTSAFRHGFAVI
jgi:hypothetical protein